MTLKGQTVLLTGAGGFIGSHLAEQLVARGCQVRAFVRYTSNGKAGFLDTLPDSVRQQIQIYHGDLRNEAALYEALEDCTCVFHLGALISIPYSYVHPREYVSVNIGGTLNVLEAIRKRPEVRLVHTSTSEVYGTAIKTPMVESHPLQAQSPYAASKTAADKLVESYVSSFGIKAITVRPFNTYGPRQSGRAVIPTIIMQALNADSVQLGNLHPKRDFTFVTDTAAGFIAAGEASHVIGEVINLCSGKEISIEELANKILAITGSKAPLVSKTARIRPEQSEVDRLLGDNSKADSLLDWRPGVSIEEGLEHTIDYIRSHPEEYQSATYHI